ncbi:ATPase, T2SS/T4P/T4SS family [Bacillus altitudinis]|uniref:ATPase, T2SS/T4P/T4SS family n=1 Tax=Bacillus altitudinis TaxID=293387 RepID=UPI0020BFFA63|nr:ATPase, T2SS/T4P/T4SS family [Bacillus altitudinis]
MSTTLTKAEISQDTILKIEEYFMSNHSEIFHNAFVEEESKDTLRGLLEEHLKNIIPEQDLSNDLDYIMSELVGLGVIDKIRKNPDVTDIGYDGTQLWVKGNGFKTYSIELETEAAKKIIAKINSTTQTELTPQRPIVNTSLNRLRVNMVDSSVATDGETFAIRISKPGLILNKNNFTNIAKEYVAKLLRAMALTKSSVTFSGEAGAGKTTLQKLYIDFIRDTERINIIETNKDMYAKETFPHKNIFYWIANENAPIDQLIQKASLRSDIDWLMVAEVVGPEVYQMYQALLTGHRISTTLHAFDARAQPDRLLGMAKEKYHVNDETFLKNIYTYLDFGIHSDVALHKDGTETRYLQEIVAFNADKTATTVYKQEFDGYKFHSEIGELPDTFLRNLRRYRVDYDGLPKGA